jgi:hypothetical protein
MDTPFSTEPEVDVLILADHVEAINGKLYLMGGCWDVMAVSSFETASMLGIALGLLVPWNQTNKQHTFILRFESEDGAELARGEGTFSVGRPVNVPAGVDQRCLVATRLPIVFPAEGRYVVVAAINGKERRRTSFGVQRLPSPAASS